MRVKAKNSVRLLSVVLVVLVVLVLTGCPPVMVSVPDVVGMSRLQAFPEILRFGLNVGNVTEQYSATASSGTVLSQSPAGGTSVAVGASVSLVVAQ